MIDTRKLLPDLHAVILHLLWLYWLLATGAATVALLPQGWLDEFRHATVHAPAVSHPLDRNAVTLSACRGKLWDSRPSAKLGPLTVRTPTNTLPHHQHPQHWSVPQQWFAHFYLLGVIANTWVLWTLCSDHATANKVAVLLACLLQLHLSRRLLETLLVMRYPPHARMHGIAYVFGMRWV